MPDLVTVCPAVSYGNHLNTRLIEEDNGLVPDIDNETIPFRSNLAAASQLFPLVFCCRGPKVFVLDLENKVKMIIQPFSGAVINYLRLGTLCTSEVLGCVLQDGYIFVWKTHDILRGVKDPWLTTRATSSCWGLAFHRFLPLIATSDNSGSVILHRLKENNSLEVVARRGRLRGNIPCVEFVYPQRSAFVDDNEPAQDEVYISYSKLYVHLLSGAIGLLKLDQSNLSMLYEYQIDQSCWTCRFLTLADFLPVSNSYELSGAQNDQNSEFPAECADHVHDHSSDPPMLWIQRQCAQTAQWIRTGRRKLDAPNLEVEKLSFNTYLFSTSASQAFLTKAGDFMCCAYTRQPLIPPDVFEDWELGHAVSMVEIVPHLNLAICATRAKSLVFFRLTRHNGRPAFRQETVIWGDDPIIGFSVAPLRAHDLSWDSENDLLDESYDANPPIGSTGRWILNVFFDNDEIRSFELNVDCHSRTDSLLS